MHFEMPKARLHSVRDFIKHYLMIMLSVLTALGLEAWITRVHHAHAAEAASRAMQTELQENLSDVHKSLQTDLATLHSVEKLDDTLSADLRNNIDSVTINQHIQAQRDALKVSINTPGLPSYAWDAAVADQSVGWINHADLKKYATAYASQRGTINWMAHDMLLMLDAPQLVNFTTDVRLGRPVDPLAFLHSIRQIKETLSSTIGNLRVLQDQLVAAVGTSPTSSATPSR